jgi:hypothetical protein
MFAHQVKNNYFTRAHAEAQLKFFVMATQIKIEFANSSDVLQHCITQV